MKLVKNQWKTSDDLNFYEYFLQLKRPEFIEFDSKLVNTNKEILGIRVPILRNLAKEIAKGDVLSFLDNISLEFYEFFSLKGLLIAKIKDPRITIQYLKVFVPKIDNWATCDIMCGDLKIVAKYKELFYPIIKEFVSGNNTFSVRVGVVLLMKYYLDGEYIIDTFKLIKTIKIDTYYVNMAVSWLLAEAYLKNKELVSQEIKNRCFNKDIINKAISKICDSFRVSNNDKQYIRQFRIK